MSLSLNVSFWARLFLKCEIGCGLNLGWAELKKNCQLSKLRVVARCFQPLNGYAFGHCHLWPSPGDIQIYQNYEFRTGLLVCIYPLYAQLSQSWQMISRILQVNSSTTCHSVKYPVLNSQTWLKKDRDILIHLSMSHLTSANCPPRQPHHIANQTSVQKTLQLHTNTSFCLSRTQSHTSPFSSTLNHL